MWPRQKQGQREGLPQSNVSTGEGWQSTASDSRRAKGIPRSFGVRVLETTSHSVPEGGLELTPGMQAELKLAVIPQCRCASPSSAHCRHSYPDFWAVSRDQF